MARLRAYARSVIGRLAGMQLHDKNFSFYGAVHELEAGLIELALELERGSVSSAARRRGPRIFEQYLQPQSAQRRLGTISLPFGQSYVSN